MTHNSIQFQSFDFTWYKVGLRVVFALHNEGKIMVPGTPPVEIRWLKRSSLMELPLVDKGGREKSCCWRGEGDQSLFILAPPRPSFKAPKDPREELCFCILSFFSKAGGKRDKAGLFFSRCLPIHVKVQSRMLPPFSVFGDKLSSASFLGRPARSFSPLDGGSSATGELYYWPRLGWRGWGGGVCLPGVTPGSAVMNRRESSGSVAGSRPLLFLLVGSFAASPWPGTRRQRFAALFWLMVFALDLWPPSGQRVFFFFFPSLFETTLPRRKHLDVCDVLCCAKKS